MTTKKHPEDSIVEQSFETVMLHPVTGDKVTFKGDSMESIKEQIDKKFGTEEN